jgi:hypothetical protein
MWTSRVRRSGIPECAESKESREHTADLRVSGPNKTVNRRVNKALGGVQTAGAVEIMWAAI